MPELPEVETIVRGLKPLLEGKVIHSIDLIGKPTFRGRIPTFLRRIKSARVNHVFRHGKSIYFELGESLLHVHLGMTGQLLWGPSSSEMKPHTHVVFHIEDSTFELRYVDIRRFGQFQLVKKRPLFLNLPDAWNNSIDDIFGALVQKNARLKHALLNQKYVVGLGNIYVDESLFLSKLHPLRKLTRVSEHQLRRLCSVIKTVLKNSIERGGTSFKNYVDISGGRGGFKESLLVYGKKGRPCENCKTPIAKKIIAGRGTHFCPTCQK